MSVTVNSWKTIKIDIDCDDALKGKKINKIYIPGDTKLSIFILFHLFFYEIIIHNFKYNFVIIILSLDKISQVFSRLLDYLLCLIDFI